MYISHSHYDHFDIKSISRFPRNIDVIIPNDPLIKTAMEKLSFEKVHVISDWTWLDFKKFKLFFTRSELRVPENGVVIQTKTTIAWNMVDSDITDETLQRVKREVGEIDIAHIQWNPFFEANVQYNRNMAFPLRSYVKYLRLAAMVDAKLNIPGASGYCYSKALSWQNNLYFPITRERFIRDFLRIANPETCLQTMEPGDSIIYEKPSHTYIKQASPGVKALHEWNFEDFRYDPNLTKSIATEEINKSSGNHNQTNQKAFDAFLTLFQNKLNENSSLLNEYRMWEVVYQINIHDGFEMFTATVDFTQKDSLVVGNGASPYANMEVNISNLALWGLIDQSAFWDHIVHSGSYRCHKSIFMLGNDGITVPSENAAHDPLWIAFPYIDAQWAKLDRNICQWKDSHCDQFAKNINHQDFPRREKTGKGTPA